MEIPASFNFDVWFDLNSLAEIAKKEKVRIEIVIEPTETQDIRKDITVEPWEPYRMTCPYGADIFRDKNIDFNEHNNKKED